MCHPHTCINTYPLLPSLSDVSCVALHLTKTRTADTYLNLIIIKDKLSDGTPVSVLDVKSRGLKKSLYF